MHILLLNALHLILIGVHCYSRAKFHDYQFDERDAFGGWAQNNYSKEHETYQRVKAANQKWHRWLFVMLGSLVLAYIPLLGAVAYGATITSAISTVVVGVALYAVLIDPLISTVALEKKMLYISETDATRVERLKILREFEPGLTSLIIRLVFFGLATILKLIFT